MYFVCASINFIYFILFKFDSEWQIIVIVFGDFIYYQSFCQKKVAGEIFFYILFWCRYLKWSLNRGLMSSKPTKYLLDFIFIFNKNICEKPRLVKRRWNTMCSFLVYEEQYKCLPNLHYGSASVVTAFRILKINLRFVNVWLTRVTI